jgi:hypothetical protein
VIIRPLIRTLLVHPDSENSNDLLENQKTLVSYCSKNSLRTTQKTSVKQANKEYSIIFTEKMSQEDIKDDHFTICDNMLLQLLGVQPLTNFLFWILDQDLTTY